MYLVANANLNTLLNFRFQNIFEADAAVTRGSIEPDKKGQDIELQVPSGTTVAQRQDTASTEVADLTAEGQRVLIAKGGLGGPATRRLPRRPTAPRANSSPDCLRGKDLRLPLSCWPTSASSVFRTGKSTMISRISAARRDRDYPFTTLVPNLARGAFGERSFVVADIPD